MTHPLRMKRRPRAAPSSRAVEAGLKGRNIRELEEYYLKRGFADERVEELAEDDFLFSQRLKPSRRKRSLSEVAKGSSYGNF